MHSRRVFVLLVLTLYLASPSVTGHLYAADSPEDLEAVLTPILESSKLPSIAAAVVKGNDILARGAVGLRSADDRKSVTIDDQYHLGSCSKMFTATLAAILIEDGLLDWDTTIGEVLGKKIGALHDDFRDVTLEQLLAHVGGLSTEPPAAAWAQAWEDQGRLKPVDQRMAFVESLLRAAPNYPPGSKTEYSNQGYAVAGVILETAAGKPWEELIKKRIFDPLEMSSAGFRAPGREGRIDQPLGHRGTKPMPPRKDADNPDAIGPAGTIHASITDWAKFARFHLRREPGMLLKDAASFDKLHAVLPTSANHGIGGWLVHEQERFGGHSIQMAGSNTMWFALMWIFPGFDMAIVVTTNAAPENAFQSCDQVVADLMQRYRKSQ